MKTVLAIVALIGLNNFAFSQQWTGSVNLDGEINRNGNTKTNGLTWGRYGGSIVGDPNPYNIYSSDGESHDLLVFGGNAATLHLRLYDGNLKLGSNSTPTSILYNSGNAMFGGQLSVGIASPYSASMIHVKNPAGVGPWSIISEAASNDRIIGLGHDGTSGIVAVSYLGGAGWSPLEFRTMNTARMAIATNGNVGVGTTSPSGLLEVSGSSSQMILNSTSANTELRFSHLGTIKGFVWYDLGTDHMAFGRGSISNSMFVTSGGNFSIGTTTPGTYKLAVEGKIGAREVNVTTGAWSDYVFNADYKLRPLSEVQQYIEENHHLPEVPSEKEVLANGQNLGEMNAILLKKIEELTLYVIEQNNELQALRTEMTELKKTQK